ncbi:MAG: carbohydrate kinase [Mucilaginibacter sp.]|nr:carbohydrate kinase [Mucilaginibacter sp.]
MSGVAHIRYARKLPNDSSMYSNTNIQQKVLCFGELLLRISPDEHGNWLDDQAAPLYSGGAEANVSMALAGWHVPVSYCSVIPDNFVARQMITRMKRNDVDISKVIYQGERLGLFYLTPGNDVRNGAVIYDRKYSSFSELKTGTIDWQKVFQGISWFHFSAISPALNQAIADICLEAVKAAHEMGITVSIDLNYRPKLWQYGKHPVEIIPDLTNYCDIVMGNLWSIEKMLGIPLNQPIEDSSSYATCVDCSGQTAEKIFNLFPKCVAVAHTFRFSINDLGLRYFATLQTRAHGQLSSREYTAAAIKDKVGTGDCFMAGLIYGFCKGLPSRQTIEFSAAAAFKKFFISGDSTNSTVAEIYQFIESDAS